ncbi:hypothetical protein NLN82_27650, partial [Citrobacter portucalensis]|nr:hypothetical protein [Citrobacter portucalensis]
SPGVSAIAVAMRISLAPVPVGMIFPSGLLCSGMVYAPVNGEVFMPLNEAVNYLSGLCESVRGTLQKPAFGPAQRYEICRVADGQILWGRTVEAALDIVLHGGMSVIDAEDGDINQERYFTTLRRFQLTVRRYGGLWEVLHLATHR